MKLQVPYLPFDGMNEHGLAIGMAAVPESTLPHDANKPAIDSLAVIREILDHARTVDEAVGILGKYNIEWGSGPALHYLIADSMSNSVLVEFFEGNMVTLQERLTKGGGELSLPDAERPQAHLLTDVSQAGNNPTQWSVIYGISTGEIDIVMGHIYEVRHNFRFPLTGK